MEDTNPEVKLSAAQKKKLKEKQKKEAEAVKLAEDQSSGVISQPVSE